MQTLECKRDVVNYYLCMLLKRKQYALLKCLRHEIGENIAAKMGEKRSKILQRKY